MSMISTETYDNEVARSYSLWEGYELEQLLFQWEVQNRWKGAGVDENSRKLYAPHWESPKLDLLTY